MDGINLKEITLGLSAALVGIITLFYRLVVNTYNKETQSQKDIINKQGVALKKLEEDHDNLKDKLNSINTSLIVLETGIENLKDKILFELSNDIQHKIDEAKNHMLKNIKQTKSLMEESLDRRYNEVEKIGENYLEKFNKKISTLRQHQ